MQPAKHCGSLGCMWGHSTSGRLYTNVETRTPGVLRHQERTRSRKFHASIPTEIEESTDFRKSVTAQGWEGPEDPSVFGRCHLISRAQRAVLDGLEVAIGLPLMMEEVVPTKC
jgi:hypothetical protein